MTTSMRILLLSMLPALALTGCGGGDDDADGDADADGDRVFVLSSDFVSSVYGWAPVDDPGAFGELGPAEGDAVAVRSNGHLAVIERTLGAVTLLTEDLSVQRNFSVADDGGAAPNPHDLAWISDTKVYVVRYGLGTIAIVDPSTGTITGTIDLSAHDPDGVPDMDAVALAGDRAYVSLERLDETYAPRGESEVVVIDTATDAVTATVTLPVANPYGRFRAHGGTGELLLPCTGAFAVPDAGIVGLGASGDAPHVLVTEQALGGDVGAFVVADDQHGFAIVAVDSVTRLVPFDPSTGEAGAPVLQSEGWDLRDVELVGDRVVVADGAPAAPGLRVLSLDGTEQTAGAVDIGLPPSIVLAL